MDKISRADKPAKNPASPAQGLNNYGARQFEYAFVKRLPLSPRGKSASAFVQCVCQNSSCVGSISCVGCVAALRSLQLSSLQLRSVASVLRPVACPLRSCASPNSMLSRMLRNSRRAATAMKVQRTAERLAHLVEQHQRAVIELSKLSAPRSGPAGQSVRVPVSSSASSELRPSLSRPCELRPVELPSASSELRQKRAQPVMRESKFASVASQSASVKSASGSVALLRPPKRSLH